MFFEVETERKKYIVYIGFFLLVGLVGGVSITNFHLPEWLTIIISIILLLQALLIISTLIIIDSIDSLPFNKYKKKATKLLTEEFNRKYPEEDD